MPDPISTFLIRLLIHLMGDPGRGARVEAADEAASFPRRQPSGAAQRSTGGAERSFARWGPWRT